MKKEKKIVSIGVLILDMFPAQLGVNLVDVKEFLPMPGGACANVAVSVSKLGIKSSFIGKVGKDYFGEFLNKTLLNYHVNTNGLIFDNERRTTMNFHAKPSKDYIQYLFYRNPGADTNLKLEEVDMKEIETAQAIHFDSLCLTDDPSRSTIIEILKVAKRSRTLVSFDFNFREVLWASLGDAIDTVNSILTYVDIFKMNDTEYSLLCSDAPLENGLHQILKLGPKLCIVTMGKEGSFIGNENTSVTIKPYEVEVVDTIGCGDSFISAFLAYALKEDIDILNLKERDMRLCGLFADTAASLTATKQGAMPALPSYEETREIFSKRI